MTNSLKTLATLVAFATFLWPVQAQITISSPTASDAVPVGDYLYISWEDAGASDSDGLEITLSTDGGATFDLTLFSGAFSEYGGTFYWEPVQPPLTSQAVVQVRNTTDSTSAFSEVFSIVAPVIGAEQYTSYDCKSNDGGITLYGLSYGETYDIYYTVNGTAMGPETVTADEGVNIYDFAAGTEFTDIYVEYEGVVSNVVAGPFIVEIYSPYWDVSTVNASCIADGEATISSLDATGESYSFELYSADSELLDTYSNVTQVEGSVSQLINGLAAGDYSIVAINEDSTNCFSTTYFTIYGGVPVIDESQVQFTLPTVAGGSDGSIDISSAVSGGISPYTYQWYSGTDTSQPIDGETSVYISGLAAGTYSVVATGENTCGSNLFTLELPDPVTVTLATSAITETSLIPGTTDNLIYAFTMSIADAPAEFEGFFVSMSGTYSEDDFAGFTIWEAVDLSDFGSATVLGTTGFVYGDTMIPDGSIGLHTDITYPAGSVVYLYVTADISEGATIGHSFAIDQPIAQENFGLGDALQTDGGLSAGATFTIVDVTIPVVSVDTLYTKTLSPALSGTVDDASAVISVTVNSEIIAGVNNGNGTWSVSAGTLTDLSEGVYDVAVTATDAAGNMGTDTTTNELHIDVTSPVVTLNSLLTNLVAPTLTGKVNEKVTSVMVTLEGTTLPAEITSDTTWEVAAGSFPDLAEGVHQVTLTATDLAGNLGLDISGIVSVDLTAPQVTFNTLTTTNPSPALSGTINDATAIVEVTVQGVAYEATNLGASEVWTLEGGILPDLTEGSYDVLVSATDEAGNSSSTEYVAGLSIQVDPDLNIALDSAALLVIYDSLGGANWTRANNWRSGVALSSWTDVTFSETGRVVALDLSANNLTGVFPAILTGLEHLTTLNLSDNAISSLPDFTRYDSLITLKVDNNHLQFDDLEPNMGVAEFTYADQELVGSALDELLAQGSNYELSIPVGGSANTYQWTLVNAAGQTSVVSEAITDAYLIENLIYETMGTYTLKVTNSLVPDLVLTSYPQTIQASANLTFTAVGTNDAALSSGIGFAFRVVPGNPYDTIQQVSADESVFLFEALVLGDYLIVVEGDLDTYLPTYYPGTDLWTEAKVYHHRADSSKELAMATVPAPLPTLPGGGTVGGLVESDFSENTGQSGRVLARRTVKRAGCSMRRFVSRGRADQEEDGEYVLIAYVQSDDEGRFTFTDLEAGRYKFTIDYPGIPMDEDSDIIFEIGEEGTNNNSLSLQATIYDDRISVEVTELLGFTGKYFRDLKVYPVPTSDYVTISYEKLIREGMMVRIVDLQGRTMQEQAIRAGYSKKVQLDVRTLPSGIYLLNIIDTKSAKQTIASYRIVVQ